jgi:hypothetical protein
MFRSEFFSQAAQGTPAVGGTWLYWATSLNWIGFLTGCYVVIQAAYLLRKWWREEKDWMRGRRKGPKQ